MFLSLSNITSRPSSKELGEFRSPTQEMPGIESGTVYSSCFKSEPQHHGNMDQNPAQVSLIQELQPFSGCSGRISTYVCLWLGEDFSSSLTTNLYTSIIIFQIYRAAYSQLAQEQILSLLSFPANEQTEKASTPRRLSVIAHQPRREHAHMSFLLFYRTCKSTQ